MKFVSGSLLCGAALLVAAPMQAQAPAQGAPQGSVQVQAPVQEDSILGLWRNPRGTIDVRIDGCGNLLCGVIARASPQAVADAREAGVENLVGTALLEDYRPAGKRRWTGTVYVPDMGNRFSSHMTLVSPGQLKIAGCILGGLICKSQTWTRLPAQPRGTGSALPAAGR